MPLLSKRTRLVSIEWHPTIKFIVEALDTTKKVHAPELVFAGDVAQ